MRVLYPGRIGIWSVFVEGGKPENPEKNPRSKDENQQQTQPTYDTGPESNPGHIGWRRALSPLRRPYSPLEKVILFSLPGASTFQLTDLCTRIKENKSTEKHLSIQQMPS